MTEPCFECGAPSEVDHHVVPRSRGGTKTVPLCGECHAKAHHDDDCMSSRWLIRSAMQAKIARGERCGKVRFGYDLSDDGKTLVPNQHEQDVIRLMAEWRTMGRSFRAIVAMLEERGVPTKEGGPWLPMTVRRILSRPA